jgi:uncharacterized cupredoxin-like copper-binding protein
MHRPARLRAVLLTAATAACTVTVAVGLTSAATTQTRALRANPAGALSFNVKTIRVAHGKVRIVMTNPSTSGVHHGIAVEGKGLDRDGAVVAPGRKSTLTVTLKRGTYEFYCPVKGHKAAGMEGKIKVS